MQDKDRHESGQITPPSAHRAESPRVDYQRDDSRSFSLDTVSRQQGADHETGRQLECSLRIS